ncbi:MAG TPA: hypothetical protein PLE19_03925 [Planctomycetota bacterium]|nr:hypothetical protein [Planctomycetota bacterium]HRR78552.1 hypothetical protein [Planctomycetota bacterium]
MGDADVHARALGEAEVGHLDAPARGEQDVGGLDVAVHDALGVGVGEGRGNVAHDLQRPLWRQAALAFEETGEGIAVHEFHRDELVAFVLSDGIHLDDVGMADGGGGAGLAVEALEEARVLGEPLRQHLDGHEAVERRLAALVDGAHAAAADEFQNLELAEGLAEEWVGAAALAGRGEHCLAARADDLPVHGRLVLEPRLALGALGGVLGHGPLSQRSGGGGTVPHAGGNGSRRRFPCQHAAGSSDTEGTLSA